ncbi:MAG: N-acetyl-D-Glu racemase DgcA [Sphingopyxis sp.]|uniref:N-acetyl-D-Glu racemase DgcA n=1 Tax=Sphingopyxis sp. TaxID=1908224 RepID=UPI002ABBE3EF|nr:N-acetyl-D-Glu racemase DgcA [Sphingopyxis sp.]MDZ3831489.1 N-acetyl-D-Glu racemase DgcA [Sphingopyxis sp.]
MLRTLVARADAFALARPFRISRGVKTVADVITVEIAADGAIGRGEGVPYPRYGETIAGALDQIALARDAVAAGATRDELLAVMPAGAARNAVDCALWDLETKLSGHSVTDRLGMPAIGATPTAMTVGLDTLPAMAAAARALADVPLIKIKVDRTDPAQQIRVVRAVAPNPRIIVDPNESWTMAEVEALQPLLAELRVDLLEQPLPADADDGLDGFRPLVPIAADESAHVAGDVGVLAGKYQVINIKLDKTGGLTGALALADAAAAAGLGVMTGSMISTSLSIAPALVIAARSAFVDLDGPLWLAADRDGGVRGTDGVLEPPSPGFWGTV